MTSTPRADIGEIIRDGSAIDRAIVAARRRVIETHRRLGVPLVVWRDGKVSEISANEVDLADVGRDQPR